MNRMRHLIAIVLMIAFIVATAGCTGNAQVDGRVLIPQIDGHWWQVAGNPDLGDYTSPKQEPVDFGVWQAADGTWQLWSCIRSTNCGGHTRLFCRWEGQSLTDTNWKPMGIAMEADPSLGEQPGGLQAPHVIKEGDTYYMFYGDWERICMATSKDGKHFTRLLKDDGQPDLFAAPQPYRGSRDPMCLKIDDTYHCYYMANTRTEDAPVEYKSVIFCCTSKDLSNWSDSVMVSAGGSPVDITPWFGGDAECPFVVQIVDLFYLFRNQLYGRGNLNTQYCSPDPLDFGVGTDHYMIGTLPVAAPEIILYDGQYYIAALLPSLKGIRIARLKWIPKDQLE